MASTYSREPGVAEEEEEEEDDTALLALLLLPVLLLPLASPVKAIRASARPLAANGSAAAMPVRASCPQLVRERMPIPLGLTSVQLLMLRTRACEAEEAAAEYELTAAVLPVRPSVHKGTTAACTLDEESVELLLPVPLPLAEAAATASVRLVAVRRVVVPGSSVQRGETMLLLLSEARGARPAGSHCPLMSHTQALAPSNSSLWLQLGTQTSPGAVPRAGSAELLLVGQL